MTPKILLVTTDDDLSELCQCALPFRVRSVSINSYAARMSSDQPDVILVDVFDADDWRAVIDLRDAAMTRYIPIVVLTDWISADHTYRDRARDLGCSAFVGKPCDAHVLASVLDRVVHGERGIEVVGSSPISGDPA